MENTEHLPSNFPVRGITKRKRSIKQITLIVRETKDKGDNNTSLTFYWFIIVVGKAKNVFDSRSSSTCDQFTLVIKR